MKYYQSLAELGLFTAEDAYKIIGNKDNANKTLSRMIKNHEIKRIKKNYYSVIDQVTTGDLMNHFDVGSHINDNSVIAFHSAFEFYGCYNQVYNIVQIATNKRFSSFIYNGYLYECYLTDCDLQIETIKGTKVTTIERTIVDSINYLGKVMDIEELFNCLESINQIDVEKIKTILTFYNKDILYRKVGYVLSCFRDDFKINDDFFEWCKAHSDIKNVGYLSYSEINKMPFIKEWGLYGYNNLNEKYANGDFADV